MRSLVPLALAGAGGAVAAAAVWARVRRDRSQGAPPEPARATCRICFDEAPVTELVSPCNCRGTIVRASARVAPQLPRTPRPHQAPVPTPSTSPGRACRFQRPPSAASGARKLIHNPPPQEFVHERCERRWQAERGAKAACSVCKATLVLRATPESLGEARARVDNLLTHPLEAPRGGTLCLPFPRTSLIARGRRTLPPADRKSVV